MKRYWLTEELARALTSLLGKEALRSDSGGTQDVSHAPAREIITCVLHEDIANVSDLVPCTRLKIIPERGDKKAWQIVIDPTSTETFELDINGTTLGPFAASDTTASFQAALSSLTDVTGYSIHGNFFIFPATSVVLTDPVEGVKVYEVPWMPLVGDAFETTVGCRTLFASTDLKRGGTHSAEFVHGYGFSIGSSTSTADGTGTGGGAVGCGCTCIPSGDIVHEGIETTSKWSATMPEVKFRQANGSVILPAGSYELIYDSGSGTWICDVGDSLIATYNSGSSATADSTLDGTLVMTAGSGSGASTSLELCVTGEIPVESGS